MGQILRKKYREGIEQAYRAGFLDAVYALAVWREGIQVVGVQEHPISEVKKDLEGSFVGYYCVNSLIKEIMQT